MRRYIIVLFPAFVLATAVILSFGFVHEPSQQLRDLPIIERTAIVCYVVDGDTISLEGGEKVRLVGIDTPELRSSDPSERMWAERAWEFVENLCPPGSVIGLNVDDLEPSDRYGRMLALVYVDFDNVWMNLNAELLRLGLAEILYLPPSEFNPYKWLS